MNTLTAERANGLFDYDPVAGVLSWKAGTYGFSRQKNGHAGTFNGKGYRIVKIDGYWYMVHRVIWLMVKGNWPRYQIDHINRDRTDNRIVNFREVNNSQNCHNQGIRYNNTSGFPGISRLGKNWRASISVRGISLRGTYHCLGQALKAYAEAKRQALPVSQKRMEAA